MKTFRRVVKLFVPYGLLRRWVARRYGEHWQEVGGTALSKCVHACLPAFVAIIDSRRRGEDRRPIKYWLPYGKMRAYVGMHYDIPLRDESKFSRGARLLRAWCPYGLILWWDLETRREQNGRAKTPAKGAVPTGSAASNASVQALTKEVQSLRWQLNQLRTESQMRDERLETLLLRVLLEIHQSAKNAP